LGVDCSAGDDRCALRVISPSLRTKDQEVRLPNLHRIPKFDSGVAETIVDRLPRLVGFRVRIIPRRALSWLLRKTQNNQSPYQCSFTSIRAPQSRLEFAWALLKASADPARPLLLLMPRPGVRELASQQQLSFLKGCHPQPRFAASNEHSFPSENLNQNCLRVETPRPIWQPDRVLARHTIITPTQWHLSNQADLSAPAWFGGMNAL